jgi:hypothetical protein
VGEDVVAPGADPLRGVVLGHLGPKLRQLGEDLLGYCTLLTRRRRDLAEAHEELRNRG